MASLLSSLWERYNSDDSWLPLIVPFSIWASCWVYCRLTKRTYSKEYGIHTFHHMGAIGQALISLYFSDDAIFNERIPILWSIPYFSVDIFDCIIEQHLTYGLHAFFCLTLGLYNYNTPLHRELRLNSKADLIETSSLLLYPVKKNRNPVLFVVFALTYTACRIIWIPIMMKQMLEKGVKWNSVAFLMLLGFYVLNLHWYRKIVMILIENAKTALGYGGKADDEAEVEGKDGDVKKEK